jgi:molybdate transport system substrate-binding protein
MMRRIAALLAGAVLAAGPAGAAEVKLLTSGAFRQVADALAPGYAAASGDTVVIVNDTAGGVQKRIAAGEAFDVVVVTHEGIADLAKSGRIDAATGTDLAKVGIGAAVRAGAPHPDIASVAAFKAALLAAKSIGYIDPAAGGSSGIYIAGLLGRLGLADQLRARTVLVNGGLVADDVAAGRIELGLQQISELATAKGVELVGPLPAEVQSYTVYAGAVGAATKLPQQARALLGALSGPDAPAVLKAKGMTPP